MKKHKRPETYQIVVLICACAGIVSAIFEQPILTVLCAVTAGAWLAVKPFRKKS